MTPTPQPDHTRDHEIIEYARRKAASLKAQNEGLLRYADKLAGELRHAQLNYSAVSERLAVVIAERDELKFRNRGWMAAAIVLFAVAIALVVAP